MKRTEDRKRAVHKALTDLIDAIPCWPLDYLEFVKIVNEIDDRFH
jgi:hypothetical protein